MSTYFVDPLNGDDSTGDGSIGDPWQTIQGALDNITRDTTNGDKINIRNNATHVLSASLNLTSYGTGSTAVSPLWLRGYANSEDDGGVATIDGNGSSISTSFASFKILQDLRLTNSGSSALINVVTNNRFINCTFDRTTGDGVSASTLQYFENCLFSSIGGRGITMQYGRIYGCYFKNGNNSFSAAINCTNDGNGNEFFGNIFDLSGNSNAIVLNDNSRELMCHHNSFYTTGDGVAIRSHGAVASSSGWDNIFINNNLFEGWATGISIEDDPDGSLLSVYGNAFYNCDTNHSLADVILTSDNESLNSTPFSKTGSNVFENRKSYFFPVDIGNVYSPFGGTAVAKGAVQVQEAEAATVTSQTGFVVGQEKVAGGTFNATTSLTVNAGELAVIVLATDNEKTSNGTSDLHTSVTLDGNSLTKLREYTSSQGGVDDGATVSIWYWVATDNVNAGSILTSTLNNGKTAKAVTGHTFSLSGLGERTPALDGINDLSGVATTLGEVSATGVETGWHIWVRGIGIEEENTTIGPLTSTGGWTALSGTGTTGNPAASNISVRAEFAIVNDFISGVSFPSLSGTHDNSSTLVGLAFTESGSAAGLIPVCQFHRTINQSM